MLFALFFVVQTINAQDATTAQSEITDEELEKYAVTMDSVEDMKASLLEDISEMVEANEKMTNARYNDLSKIIDDEAALKEAKATPEEIAFLKEVAAKKEEGTKKIQETFQTMAKEFVGASSYNKIKDQLKTNPELKKRYESQLDKLGDDSDVN
jgi:predicted  nucleic acid-binding Zn-ribbon protein